MKNFKTVIICLLALCLVMVNSGCELLTSQEKTQKEAPLTKVFNRVYKVETYSQLDYSFSEKYFKKNYGNFGGGCTAVAKTLDDDTTLVGRNLDLTLSDKCVYILHTKVDGSYETFGLSYNNRDISPESIDVENNGLSSTFKKILPFMSEDVLNSEGLYIESNTRLQEAYKNGDSKFSCSGTNPNSQTTVYAFALPRYIGEHCSTVNEALKYVKSLNIYTDDGFYNYCFLLADRTGHYGVLEIAHNSIIWHDYQNAQTNFYIDNNLSKIEEYRCGVGRYKKVLGEIDNVKNAEDMYNLLNDVTYFQINTPKDCKFDYRSEFVGKNPGWTYSYVTDDKNRKEIEKYAIKTGKKIIESTRDEIVNSNDVLQTVFTDIVNCKKKTMDVYFFEEESLKYTISFDSGEN